MTETVKKALPVDKSATDHLKAEVQSYLTAQAERLLLGAGRKLGGATARLDDVAEGRSPGFAKLALEGGKKVTEGKGPVRSAVELGATHMKDKVMDAFKGLGGGGKRKKGGAGQKPTVIMEHIDVGVPLRDAYDQWTQLQDFSTFAKGVKNVTVSEDTQSDWKLKVFWSNRSWKATTTEQVPDHRIAWTSEGAKGSTKGVVTFHPLGESLTRVVLVMEYYPKGLFEKTGNIWRAQGRRARLDLKNYARHISLLGEAEEGWRGEIQDGEVVRSHEEALEAEAEAGTEAGTDEEPEPSEERDEYDEEPAEEAGEPEQEYEEEEEEYAEEEPEAEPGEEREYAETGARER